MPKANKPEPVIAVTSPWGQDVDPEKVTPNRDMFWVEGYSDKRQAFDEAIRERERPTSLPFRMQYVSIERASGAPVKEKESYFRARGYLPVMYDEAAKYGIDATKSGFIKGPDGTCRVGSQMLMACPASKVAAHVAEERERNEALLKAYQGRAEAAAQDYNRRHPGAEPTEFEFNEKTGATAPSAFEFEHKMFKD